MTKIFNKDNLNFKVWQDIAPDFSWHTSEALSKISNSENLMFDVRSLDANKYSYPYHFHRNAEELVVIFSGCMMMRTLDGKKELKKGDIIFFEKGETSAHQFYNHKDEPCIYLDIRTFFDVDICEYPDSGKVNIIPYGQIYKKEDRVSYFEGEDNVKKHWTSDDK